MFSKSRINESSHRNEAQRAPESPAAHPAPRPSMDGGAAPGGAPKTKPAASVLSADLQITGNLRTAGDVVIEGVVDGDVRAHLLTVGETATIRGEIVADDIVINGRVIGRVRGLKVRLTSTARVEGDIIHKTIAIESGAHFEGSVQRQDDPLASATPAVQAPRASSAGSGNKAPAGAASGSASSPAPAPRPASPASSAPSSAVSEAVSASRASTPKAPVDSKK